MTKPRPTVDSCKFIIAKPANSLRAVLSFLSTIGCELPCCNGGSTVRSSVTLLLGVSLRTCVDRDECVL
jgi:hypothetical protein